MEIDSDIFPVNFSVLRLFYLYEDIKPYSAQLRIWIKVLKGKWNGLTFQKVFLKMISLNQRNSDYENVFWNLRF